MDFTHRRKTNALGLGSLVILLAAAAACGDSGTGPGEGGVALPGGSALVFQDGAASSEHRPRIEEIVRETVVAARSLIPLDGITIIVRLGTAGGIIPQLGFGGRADAGTVTMTINPDSPALAGSLESEFFRVLAHEFHHVARFRTAGFAENLLEAMVTEGLADRFMVELAGGDPPVWATALKGAELETWLANARVTWLEPQYDHAAWFFIGASSTIPQWAGYAVGFEITGRFLGANPSERASTLIGEPATSFIPADQASLHREDP